MNDYDIKYYIKDRDKYANAIITSRSRRRLIVAGPGTGKTHLFKSLFQKIKSKSDEKGLALTFIRNLVADLKIDLAGLAKVSTFHAFCKSVVQSFKNEEFEYYPKLLKVIEKDFEFLELDKGSNKVIERCFFGLKDEKVITSTVNIGDYYNAAGHTDSVFRAIKYFQSNEEQIPSYPLIVVDEYQDFNFLEISLVEMLSRKSPVLIVGDDDQALYAFKQATPDYIRRLAYNPKYKRFELPYCSRCPRVIIEAVNRIVRIAEGNGRLEGRVNKPFKYFPPDKEEDSKRHPKILNINCTVERKNCHYIGKLIANEISKIPISYIHESAELKEPTALVIGPKHFLDGVRDELAKKLGYIPEKVQEDNEVDLLDGYRSITKKEKSRLGWRILLNCDPCSGIDKIVKKAISEKQDIYNLILSKRYIAHHQKMANIIKSILAGKDLSIAEQKSIEAALGLTLSEIKIRLLIDEEEQEITKYYYGKKTDKPRVLCTSFEGAKGLAAQYVFIVGVNEKHFPQKTPPGDSHIFKLIVALTRTRKKCYLISCNIFGGVFLNPSIFKSWLKDQLSDELYVDKSFITKYCT